MSEEISTRDQKIKIYSTTIFNIHHISAYRKGEADFAVGEYDSQEYGNLLKGIWEKYLDLGEIPKLLLQPLSDEGLTTETLHYIAQSGFWAPGTRETLNEQREQFVYWLQSQRGKISIKLGDYLSFDETRGFYPALDNILSSHLGRKQNQKVPMAH